MLSSAVVLIGALGLSFDFVYLKAQYCFLTSGEITCQRK